MALLRAWVTDTPVTLCLDSKVGTAVLLVLVLIPISLPVPQRWGRRVWQLRSNYNDQILLSSYTHFSLRLRQANLSSSHYQHLLIQPGWQHATPTAVWVWHISHTARDTSGGKNRVIDRHYIFCFTWCKLSSLCESGTWRQMCLHVHLPQMLWSVV